MTRESLRTHLRIATCYNLLMREARQLVGQRWKLTLPQFDVLAELARAEQRGFTFVELSRLLLVTSGNLTGIVNRLEQQRLVARRPDLKDREEELLEYAKPLIEAVSGQPSAISS